jgi:hypothetical protein
LVSKSRSFEVQVSKPNFGIRIILSDWGSARNEQAYILQVLQRFKGLVVASRKMKGYKANLENPVKMLIECERQLSLQMQKEKS